MLTLKKVIIEGVLIFSVTAWFGSITVKDKFRLNRVVKSAFSIIGRYLPRLKSKLISDRTRYVSVDSARFHLTASFVAACH